MHIMEIIDLWTGKHPIFLWTVLIKVIAKNKKKHMESSIFSINKKKYIYTSSYYDVQ